MARVTAKEIEKLLKREDKTTASLLLKREGWTDVEIESYFMSIEKDLRK